MKKNVSRRPLLPHQSHPDTFAGASRANRRYSALGAIFFADRQSLQNRLSKVEFTSAAFELLEKMPFGGNIRELKNLIDRTILVSGKSMIDAADIQLQDDAVLSNSLQTIPPLGLTLEEMEMQSILQAMEQCGGNLSKVARTLGISRAALYRRMEKYGL